MHGVRINPGFGSGFCAKTCVAGPEYSFGIWYTELDIVIDMFKKAGKPFSKIHCHIGAGSDPNLWLSSAKTLFELIESKLPEVTTLNLGGGFKIYRGEGDKETDLDDLSSKFDTIF